MPIVAIDKIGVGLNRRPIKPQKVAELMESIKANGLLNPITIDQDYKLVAGLHRLTACKMLGRDRIECTVIAYEDAERARLAEIDENLIRSELDTLERGELWLEREQILEGLNMRARPGDNQYTRKGGEIISPPLKTTSDIAREVGYTERTVQQNKQIARNTLPEIKELIKSKECWISKSTKALLEIARAGTREREVAEQAEQAAREAKARGEQEVAERQDKIAVEARAQQKDLQLAALRCVLAQKEAKAKKVLPRRGQKQEEEKSIASTDVLSTQPGDKWYLDRHLVYCGNTSGREFIQDCLPSSDVELAIATPADTWNHDYLVDRANVVAVLLLEGNIHEFCRRHQMPFRFELTIGNIYVALFSRMSISRPQRRIEIEGVEGIIAFLVGLYTNPSNFVIAPFMGGGEVLIACEKMKRICFAGDETPRRVSNAIARWQDWSEKQAIKN